MSGGDEGEQPIADTAPTMNGSQTRIDTLINDLTQTITERFDALEQTIECQHEDIFLALERLGDIESNLRTAANLADVVPRESLLEHLERMSSGTLTIDHVRRNLRREASAGLARARPGNVPQVHANGQDVDNENGNGENSDPKSAGTNEAAVQESPPKGWVKTDESPPKFNVLGGGRSLAVEPEHVKLAAAEQTQMKSGRRVTRASSRQLSDFQLQPVVGNARRQRPAPASSAPAPAPSKRKASQSTVRKRGLEAVVEDGDDQDVQVPRKQAREKKAKKGMTKEHLPTATSLMLPAASDKTQSKPASSKQGRPRKDRALTTDTDTAQHSSNALSVSSVMEVEPEDQVLDDALPQPGLHEQAGDEEVSHNGDTPIPSDWSDPCEFKTEEEARKPTRFKRKVRLAGSAREPARRVPRISIQFYLAFPNSELVVRGKRRDLRR
ncbi:hypothetical protein LTR95_006955 [Oleoguttula sp. CCFEE 5521]